MKRRSCICSKVAAVSVVLGACLLTVALGSASGGDRPNLLVIQTDEHHYNTLGCYGGKIVGTPNIDWLAENGAICTSFYATTPVCSPSRAALITGRYPQNTDVVTNNIPLRDGLVTFAEVLKSNGYATGFAGKWHLDGTAKPGWAPKRKFGFDDNGFMFNRGHWKMLEDQPKGPRVAARNRQGRPDYGIAGADSESFTTDWLTIKTINFIQAHSKVPFCFMLSIPDPHGPNTVRPPYDTMYADVKVPIPSTLSKSKEQTPSWAPKQKVTRRNLAKIMPKYWGMVKCIDDNVGRILATLRRHKLLENTIIIFTSDHGDLCGQHCRLNKGVPYEGSARIPFLMYYPGRVKPGTTVRQALTCVDFFPTIMSLMGHRVPQGIEGRDASVLFTGKASSEWKDVAFMRSVPRGGWLCAVTDDYKLVYSKSGKPWLFDLKKDPDEVTNVFDDSDYRDVARQLTKDLTAYCAKHRDPYGNEPKIKAAMQAAAASK